MGDISTQIGNNTVCMMFNKKLIRDFGLEDPYALVRSGDWTTEKLSSMIKGLSKDLNADGVYDDTDQYGLTSIQDIPTMLFYSNGNKWINTSQEGLAQLNTFDQNKMQNILDMTIDIMKNDDSTYIWMDVSKNSTAKVFEENRAAFFMELLGYCAYFRSMSEDFGVLPLPKYDKEQENYLTYVHNSNFFLTVPVNHPDKEFVGIILEAMAAEGARTIRPAYYDVTLKTKSARDEDSWEMMDILYQNHVYDLGLIFDFGGLSSSYKNLALQGKNNLTSTLEKLDQKVESALVKFNAQFDE